MLEVTLEEVYYGKLKFSIVNYGGKNKDDPSLYPVYRPHPPLLLECLFSGKIGATWT